MTQREGLRPRQNRKETILEMRGQCGSGVVCCLKVRASEDEGTYEERVLGVFTYWIILPDGPSTSPKKAAEAWMCASRRKGRQEETRCLWDTPCVLSFVLRVQDLSGRLSTHYGRLQDSW